MKEPINNLNFDTNKIIVSTDMYVGEVVKVSADVELTDGEPAPIGWQMRAASKGSKPCFEMIAEDGMKGTMTFKALSEGWAEVTYRKMVDGKEMSKSVEFNILPSTI